MDKQLQEYYQARLDMFASKGWKDLLDDLEAMIVSTNTLDGVDDEKKLHFRKGELSIMLWLKTLKDVSEDVYKSLQEKPE